MCQEMGGLRVGHENCAMALALCWISSRYLYCQVYCDRSIATSARPVEKIADLQSCFRGPRSRPGLSSKSTYQLRFIPHQVFEYLKTDEKISVKAIRPFAGLVRWNIEVRYLDFRLISREQPDVRQCFSQTFCGQADHDLTKLGYNPKKSLDGKISFLTYRWVAEEIASVVDFRTEFLQRDQENKRTLRLTTVKRGCIWPRSQSNLCKMSIISNILRQGETR